MFDLYPYTLVGKVARSAIAQALTCQFECIRRLP
jgi:hypothetical protein